MKNIKEYSAEIKKEIGKPNRKSTESITIRLTKDGFEKEENNIELDSTNSTGSTTNTETNME